MTFLTLSSELADVYVILGMTRYTVRFELDFRGWSRVAALAIEFCVRSIEREARLFAVVEFPHAPAVGGVTFRALAAEASLMDIFIFVTTDAAGISYPERAL